MNNTYTMTDELRAIRKIERKNVKQTSKVSKQVLTPALLTAIAAKQGVKRTVIR